MCLSAGAVSLELGVGSAMSSYDQSDRLFEYMLLSVS